MISSANTSQDDITKNPVDQPPNSSFNPVSRFYQIADPHTTTPHEDRLPPMPPQLTQIHKSSFLGEILRIIAYDLVLWFFNLVLHTFFRDIKSRGTFNIPKQGPIVFVIAPHHNQFVDPLVVMSIVREYSNRRISFLVAAKSYRRKFIGTMSKWCSAIPVERAQDLLKPVPGKIFIKNLYPKDENDDCNLIVEGKDTFFTKNCMEKGLIGLPDSLGNAQVEKVFSDTKLKLRKPFDIKSKDSKVIELLTNGTEFRSAPHIDNNVVFQNVFDHLNAGKVLGMFPEGGSHDRPDLLPLKPGVAIMALGAAAKSSDPNQMINVIPVGMNYFHPHKFRSRVVIEFGKAIKVSKEDGLKYQEDSRTQVGRLLDLITLRLREVTVLCDDYDTLMALQAARRLYTSSKRESIPLPLVVEMNRRLIKGYQKYSKNPDVIEMKKSVSEYNKNLMRLGLHDHQVEKITSSDRFENFIIFSNRLFKVVLFFILSLPGALMFSPVFIISRKISKQKAKEALEGSVVKIKAKDVLGSWKIMVALGIAPMLYIFWSICGVLIIKHNFNTNINGWLLFIIFYCWSVLTTYASLRIGEIGVDYYKSLKPLVYSLLSHHLDVKQIEDLKKNRQILSNKVTKFCNKYGPGIFEDFDNFYKRYNNIEDADFKIEESSEDEIPSTRPKFDKNLSKTESFNLNNLSDIPIFSNANFLDPFTNHEEEDDEEGEEEQSHEHESESESEIEDIDKPNENASIKLRNAMMKRRS